MGVTINIYDHENFDPKILAEVNTSAKNLPSEKIYLNGSKFISKLKLFSNDNSISDELKSFMSKDVLINEANIVLHLDEEMSTSNSKVLPERLYIYSYDNGSPIEDYNKDFSIDLFNNLCKYRISSVLEGFFNMTQTISLLVISLI